MALASIYTLALRLNNDYEVLKSAGVVYVSRGRILSAPPRMHTHPCLLATRHTVEARQTACNSAAEWFVIIHLPTVELVVLTLNWFSWSYAPMRV